MKKVVLILASVMWSVFLFRTGSSQEYMTVVDNGVFNNPRRPPSRFSHDEHNEAAGIEKCNGCHHVYQDGQFLDNESSEDQMCSDCHRLEDTGSRPSLVKAFHANCKGCHLQENQGPIMCGECHVK